MNLKNKRYYGYLIIVSLLLGTKNITNDDFKIFNTINDDHMAYPFQLNCSSNETIACRSASDSCYCTAKSSGSSSNRNNGGITDTPSWNATYPSGMVGQGADYKPDNPNTSCAIPGTIFNSTIGYCVSLSDNPPEYCSSTCYNGGKNCGAVLYTTGDNATCIWDSVGAGTKKNNKIVDSSGSPTLDPNYPSIPGTVAQSTTKVIDESVAVSGCSGTFEYDSDEDENSYEYKNIIDFPTANELGYDNAKKVILMSYIDPNATGDSKVVKYACSLKRKHSINIDVSYSSLSKINENKFGTGTGISPNVEVTTGTIRKEITGYGLFSDLENDPNSKKCPQVYYKIELNDGSVVEKTVDHPACASESQVDLRKMCGNEDDVVSNLDTSGIITITENDKKTDFTSVRFEMDANTPFQMPDTYIDIFTGNVSYDGKLNNNYKKIDNGYYVSLNANNGTGKILVDATTKYNVTSNNSGVEYSITVKFNVCCPFDIVNRTNSYDDNGDDDGNNGNGYYYRSINIGSVFEHRVPDNSTVDNLKEKVGTNWRLYYFDDTNGYTSLRDRIGDTYNNNAKYVIKLDNETINKIKDYNDNHNYLDMDFGIDGSSRFLAEEIDKAVEKPTSTTGSIGGANASHYRIGCGPLNMGYSWCSVEGSDNQ